MFAQISIFTEIGIYVVIFSKNRSKTYRPVFDLSIGHFSSSFKKRLYCTDIVVGGGGGEAASEFWMIAYDCRIRIFRKIIPSYIT